MDPDKIGEDRIGYSRIGVYKDVFDPTRKQFESIRTPNKITVGGTKKWIVGGASVRIGVQTNHFADLKKRLEAV